MVAMPLGFPGVSAPIEPNDSFVTRLALGPDQMIYGGASGVSAHLFVASAHAARGVVIDLGGDGCSTECAGIACTQSRVVAALNGEGGGRLLSRGFMKDFDAIQEWAVDVAPFELRTELDFRVTDMVPNAAGDGVIGAGGKGLFAWRQGADELLVNEEVSVTRLTADKAGAIYGINGEGQVYRVSDRGDCVAAEPGARLAGDWAKAAWSASNPPGAAYLADDEGNLYRVRASGEAERVGRTHLGPVTCMTVTHDGRLYGFCGDGISNLFVYDPRQGSKRNLGVAVSVLNRRRYGYQFACALTNRDGEMYFGENDRGGHLWVYFPAVSL